MFVTKQLDTGELRSYQTRDEATADALRLNRASRDHPAFYLWVLRSRGPELIVEYVGRLDRKFGSDFEADPWNRGAV